MYIPLKEMTDQQLQEEHDVWSDAVTKGRNPPWVAKADGFRNACLAEMMRRKRDRGAADPVVVAEHRHQQRQELEEIADGAFGDGPFARGAAKRLLDEMDRKT